MRIVVDAMGGDHAPDDIVRGAALAAAEYSDTSIVLTGDSDRIKGLLKECPAGDRIEVVHTTQVIETSEPPVAALRRKKDSSLVVAVKMVRDGQADGVVTAGSTGAFMAGCLLTLGRLNGIDRPALASVLPTLAGRGSLLIDMGANVDCKPEHLLQFAVMGSCYATAILGVESPRVGLLNVGVEEEKGSEPVKAAHQLLKTADLNFVGNIEARDVPAGAVDVVVCDGFAGNVILKLTEGLSSAIFSAMKQEFTRTPVRTLGAMMLKPAFAGLKRRLDYAEYGGAPLLGLNGAAIKCHGSSNARAIKNGIRVARQFVAGRVSERIAAHFTTPQETSR